MPDDLIEDLEKQLLSLAGHLHATEYKLIKLLDEFDRIDGWHGIGIMTFAHWLNWKLGMGHVIAREKIRIAKALRELPKISEAFGEGIISYSKVRAMTRVATPENETFLLQIAEHGTAAQMETLIRKYKVMTRGDEEHHGWTPEKLVSWFLADEDVMEIRIRLPKEDADVVITAINRIADELYQQQVEQHQAQIRQAHEDKLNAEVRKSAGLASSDVSAETSLPTSCEPPRPGARLADALVCLAERSLAQDTPQNTGTNSPIRDVVVHLNANPEHIDCKINNGPCAYTDKFLGINDGVIRRVTCDARLTPIKQDNQGNVLDVGRKTRVISPALRLALSIRDQGCKFPGCTQTKWTDAHHVQHWIDGGETKLDNLVTLCRHHHTALHRGEFLIDPIENGFRFRYHDGDYIPDCAWEFPKDAYDVLVESKPHQPLWNGDKMDLDHALFCLDAASGTS